MARTLQPCGTPAAHRRHLRNGEKPCLACLRAEAERVEARRSGRHLAPVASIPAAPSVNASDIPDDIDPLADARLNLQMVNDAMASAVPREIASLSRRRQDLVALIVELGGKKEVSLADQLAAARAAREGRRSGT